MNKINLITSPDKLFNDTYKILLVFPSKPILTEIQNRVLSRAEHLNLYLYNNLVYNKDDVNWLLDSFYISDFVLIDIDNSPLYCRDLFSFLIAKPKTFWLTNAENCIYNHISNNRLLDLDILSKIGDRFEES